MNGRQILHGASGIAILAALALATPALARVGVTSTTAGDPVGKPVDQAQRVLRVGVDVFANERVTTGANDRAQLLFLDGSALSVGPNSELTLDRYVYDPAKGTGTIAISAGKGILRLVGGAITKETEATIRTPSGTIGIRGGITIVEIIDQSLTNAYFVFGRGMRGTNEGRTETATRAGSAIVLRAGRPPSSPFLANQQTLASALGLLEAPSGRVPGNAPPVEQRMAQSGVGQQNSGNPNISPPPAPGTATTTSPPPVTQPPVNPASQVPIHQTGAGHTPPPNPPGSQLALMGRLIRDVPHVSFDPATRSAMRDPVNNAAVTSALLNGTTLTLTTDAGSTATVPYLLGGSYSVTNAPSSFGLLNGGAFNGSGDIYLFDLLDPHSHRVILIGVQPGTVSDFSTTGFGAHVMLTLGNSQPFMPAGSHVTFNGAESSSMFSAYAPVLSPVTASNQRSVFMQSTLYVSGSGSAQTSFFGGATGVYMKDQTKADSVYAAGGFNGTSRDLSFHNVTAYAAAVGTMETTTGNVVGQNSGFMAFVPDAIQTDNVGGTAVTTRTVQAGVSILPNGTMSDYSYVTGAAGTGQPSDLGVNRTSRTLSGYGAALVENHGSSGIPTDYGLLNVLPNTVSLTTDASTNRAQLTMTLVDPNASNGLSLSFGSLTGNGQDSAFIDDRRIGMRQSSTTGAFYAAGSGNGTATPEAIAVTQAVTPNTTVDGVAFCACEYLTWGYWSADITYPNGPRAGERDRVHIGTWVAGELPTPAQLPTTGTAVYNGHVIGSVSHNGNRYLAAGTFQQNWNFATHSGSVAVHNFDGANYSGATTGIPGNVTFAGTLSGSGRSGIIAGSFFKSPTDPVAYQAGTLSITGTNYKATGTFAGQR